LLFEKNSHPEREPLPSPKIRVLFLNTRSALGADVAVHLTLIQNFDPSQVEVFVATNRNAVDLEQTLAILRSVPGLKPLALNLGTEISRPGAGRLSRFAGALQNLSALPSLARLAWLIRTKRIDLVHSTDRPRDALFSTLLARFGGCGSVLHVHIKWDVGIGRATKWAVGHSAGIIAISQFARRSMQDGGVDDTKIHTCLNATDTVLFDPQRVKRGALRAQLKLAEDTPLVGIVARIMLWKGHLELVEAMAKVIAAVPTARLVIIGKEDRLATLTDDSFEATVRDRIAELGLRQSVDWAGWHDDMPAVMADLDVLAVPSWEEPFGLVVTEGMAMERPIVGFASGALPEILTDGVEGLLVPVRDSNAMACALIALLQDPARCAAMGRKGRERVRQHFTPRRQADEMAAIYRQILDAEHLPTRAPV
jgi:glycosyltransferase involved in cell wall biosynthesis